MIESVTVERARDELVVTWSPAGPARVAVGTSPEEASTAAPIASADGTSVTLSGLDFTVRHYVHVDSGDGPGVVAAERLLPVEGAMNLRDLGGYRTVDGRRTRWGRVYRSDHLSTLTVGDLAYLSGLGLKLVCDFRDDHEVAAAATLLPDPGPVYHRLPMASDQPDIIERILAGEITDFTVDTMAEMYEDVLTRHAAMFGGLIDRLADPANLPAVYHCTAGKDRTGLASALILGVLGVPDETILDDYELTTTYRSGRRLAQLRPQMEAAGVDVDRVGLFITAPRPVLAVTLERMGSADRYLTDQAGVAPATLDRLRHLLLS